MIELKRREKPYKKFNNIAYGETIRESKIASFSYACFLDYVRSWSYQPKKKIWLHIMDTLKGLIHGLRYTAKTFELLKVFLFFINNLITFYGCGNE